MNIDKRICRNYIDLVSNFINTKNIRAFTKERPGCFLIRKIRVFLITRNCFFYCYNNLLIIICVVLISIYCWRFIKHSSANLKRLFLLFLVIKYVFAIINFDWALIWVDFSLGYIFWSCF